MGSGPIGGTPEELAQPLPVDATVHVAKHRQLRAGEAMAQVQAALAIDCQQTDSGATRQRLAASLVQVRHQLVHVREAVVPATDRELQILLTQPLETGMHLDPSPQSTARARRCWKR